jgi:ribosomal protein S18 acetylase RimI-like enzyme
VKRAQSDEACIQIRIAAPDDAARITSVLHESFIEYKSSYTDEAFSATVPAPDQIRKRMAEGPVWMALQGDTIVGTVAAVERGGELYIRGMAVSPAARGLGIGELLLKHMESFAESHGVKRLTLSTTPFLDRAIRLYERFGFRRSEEGPHDLFGTPLFTMVKSL